MGIAYSEQQAQAWMGQQLRTMQDAFSRAAVALADAMAAHEAGDVVELKLAADACGAETKSVRSAAERISNLVSIGQSVASQPNQQPLPLEEKKPAACIACGITGDTVTLIMPPEGSAEGPKCPNCFFARKAPETEAEAEPVEKAA